MRFIIEHLEPKLYKWCFLEYKHISSIVGKNKLLFTNIKTNYQCKKLKNYGKVIDRSFKNLKLKKMCILDPSAKNTLNPKECKNIDYLIFGGILGDYPPKKRTKQLRVKGAIYRNLGKKQMPTDNAVYVSYKISKGKSINNISFKDKPEIYIGKNLSLILPYRYVYENNKLLISQELLNFIKKKKGF